MNRESTPTVLLLNNLKQIVDNRKSRLSKAERKLLSELVERTLEFRSTLHEAVGKANSERDVAQRKYGDMQALLFTERARNCALTSDNYRLRGEVKHWRRVARFLRSGKAKKPKAAVKRARSKVRP